MLIVFSLVGYHVVSANERINETEDIIVEQNHQENYYSSYGYTIDNPHIILNPYQISPLTALILFETGDEVSITVTVEGKDLNTTYQNTFFKSKKHIIPIYGLYPNYENKVIISYENIKKEYVIKTDPLPKDFKLNDTNILGNLTFISDDYYSYAIDQNKDVRWFLSKKYLGKITKLENGHFLLGSDIYLSNHYPKDILEIDLLGKIFYQYSIKDGYYGTYAETNTSLFVLSKNLIEIDRQSGVVLNEIKLQEEYHNISYNKDTNMLELKGKHGLVIKKDTLESASKSDIVEKNERIDTSDFYSNQYEYRFVKGVKFSDMQETELSKKNIFLIGYKKIDTNYLNYHIQIQKTVDYLQIDGDFNEQDEVYIILDKFLDKKIYDMTENKIIINKSGLNGKYSIYIKINDTIYKTNYFVIF